jgi:phosphatidylinositol glycan class B
MGMALYLLNKSGKKASLILAAGILCGFSFVFRYQTAFMISGLGLWMIFIAKEKFKTISVFAIGNIIAILIGVIIDRWFYGKWVLSFWNYLDFNLIQDKVSEFGILPWWFYFEAIFNKATPPFGILLIVSFLWVCIKFPKHVITWVSIPFVLIHIIIGHKELRFLYPLMFFVPVYIGLFIDNISKNKAFDMLFKNRYFKGFISFLIALNIMLLVLMCFKPADEMISFYKKVYNLSGYPKTELITIGSENPYFRGGKNLAITYYKKANLNFKQLQSDTLLSKNLIIDKNTQYLFAVKKFDVRSEFEMNGLHFSKVYQTYPQWVVNFNFNNWMARTKVWTIYEVKK